MKKKILICLFVLSITLPNLLFWPFFAGQDSGTNEKRELAGFPEINLTSLTDFPSGFEEYYNDHLPFKSFFVSLNNKIEMNVFRNTSVESVKIGKDKWLFYLISKEGENSLADYQKTNIYSEEQCEDIAHRLERAGRFFKEQGAEQFHYYVAPSKESIYDDYMPANIRTSKEEKSRIQVFAEYMKENDRSDFTYLYDELKEASERHQVYFKYDTHLNNIGAFVISQRMSEDVLGKSVPENQVSIEKYGIFVGDLGEMISQEASLQDDCDYAILNYYPDTEAEIVQRVVQGEEMFQEIRTNSDNHRTLMLIGDSSRLREEPFFEGLYDRIISVHIDAFEPEMVTEYRPDDVIILTVERNQDYMEKIDEYLGVYDQK